MKKYVQIIDEKTKLVDIGEGDNTDFYKYIGMTQQEVEQAYNGQWYLKGFAPAESIESQNEKIRAERERLYTEVSDKIKIDYDEAVARGSENAEQLKTEWLESKDKIRAENPYIKED